MTGVVGDVSLGDERRVRARVDDGWEGNAGQAYLLRELCERSHQEKRSQTELYRQR